MKENRLIAETVQGLKTLAEISTKKYIEQDANLDTIDRINDTPDNDKLQLNKLIDSCRSNMDELDWYQYNLCSALVSELIQCWEKIVSRTTENGKPVVSVTYKLKNPPLTLIEYNVMLSEYGKQRDILETYLRPKRVTNDLQHYKALDNQITHSIPQISTLMQVEANRPVVALAEQQKQAANKPVNAQVDSSRPAYQPPI